MTAAKLNDGSVIVVVKDQVSCDLAGETAILNLKTEAYYGLDPVGARVWNLLQQPRTFRELREILLTEYEVDAERLNEDLCNLLDRLAEQQLVQVSE